MPTNPLLGLGLIFGLAYLWVDKETLTNKEKVRQSVRWRGQDPEEFELFWETVNHRRATAKVWYATLAGSTASRFGEFVNFDDYYKYWSNKY